MQGRARQCEDELVCLAVCLSAEDEASVKACPCGASRSQQ